MQDEIIIKTPAKINLFLRVFNKRMDGYHNIFSAITFIDLYDEIKIKLSNLTDITYLGPFKPDKGTYEDCIIKKTLKKFINNDKINLSISVIKNIPVQGGLGSASTNAAGIIKGLDKLNIIDLKKLNNFSYGADITPFLFVANFSDGTQIEVQVNNEFENKTNAEKVALKYVEVIGKLPGIFRKDVETVWIHKGNESFGGRNNNILIHHDRGLEREKYGLLEEVFLHEGAHTSLDSDHSSSNGWIEAQIADNGNFISDYAEEYPQREDVAETFPLCFALKYKRDRLDNGIIQKIEKAIPNRIKYCNNVFENMN